MKKAMTDQLRDNLTVLSGAGPWSQGKDQTSSKATRLQLCCASFALLVLVFAVFFEVRHAEFLNIDDDEYVTHNQYVNSGLTWQNIAWAFSRSHSGHWHPLTWVSHMLDCELFGLDPASHHLVNLALHAANTVLLFALIYTLTGALWRALFVSAFIGVNPLRLESVAWVAERKDVLSIFFALMTILLYVSYVRRPHLLRYLGVVAAYTLGLLAKPMLVSLPLLLLLLDFWPLRRLKIEAAARVRLRNIFLEKLPLVFLALIASYMAIKSQEIGGGLKSLSDMPLQERFAAVFIGFVTYLGKLIWPFNLGVFYPSRPFPSGLGAGAFLAMTGITIWVIRQAKDHSYLFVGFAWFVCALLPVIGIVQVGGQHVADRWTYLPHIGLAFGVTWYVCENMRRRSTSLLLTLLGSVIVGVLASVTYRGVRDWKTSESLFTRTLQVEPDNFFAHTNLGVALENSGRVDGAVTHYKEAIRLNPYYGIALNNLGAVYARRGNYTEAIGLFDRALNAHPQFILARYHRALARELMGAAVEAMSEWLLILQNDPTFTRARDSLRFVVARERSKSCGLIRQQAQTLESRQISILASRVEQWVVEGESKALKQDLRELVACLS